MNFLKYASILSILIILTFVACDEGTNEPEVPVAKVGVEAEITAMDEVVGQMSSSPMLLAMLQFQSISGEILGGGQLLMAPQFIPNNELRKTTPGFSEVKMDTSLVALFLALELMKGTHTYNEVDSSWSSSDQPEDAVVFIFSFQGLDGIHTAQITISNINLTNTIGELDMVFAIDGVPALTAGLEITGTNFKLPGESSMSKVELAGTIATANGLAMNYGISVTETTGMISLEVPGTASLTITAQGSGFISSGLAGDGGETSVNSITLSTAGSLEIVITDTNAESGKIGDVYYQDEDVADLVIENEEIYIKYNSETKTNLAELMPNTFTMISLLVGISGS